MNGLNRLKAYALFRRLRKIQVGALTIETPDGRCHRFVGASADRDVMIMCRDWSVFARVLAKSDVGLAEAYRDGRIDVSSIADLVHLICSNPQLVTHNFNYSWIFKIIFKLRHILRRNSKIGSKKNIEFHYDLGNEFYGLWLDSTMTYSSAIFSQNDETLEDGQHNKYERILDQIQAGRHHHILEIGCGWGGFFSYAARTRGCRVTAITISKQQFEFCQQRIRDENLEGQVDVLLCDYRDLQGKFDAVVSIEMIEAVGVEYWPQYFNVIHDCLKKGGQAVIQAITIQDSLFAAYRKHTDFIQQYIFPGGMLVSEGLMTQTLQNHKLRLIDGFRFGGSYAETLRRWHNRFDQQIENLKQYGFDESFLKLWKFYLGYCEGAFSSGRINVAQYVISKN